MRAINSRKNPCFFMGVQFHSSEYLINPWPAGNFGQITKRIKPVKKRIRP
jgi:hypothetical protein